MFKLRYIYQYSHLCNIERPYTSAPSGTMLFTAPEILQNIKLIKQGLDANPFSYGYQVDWWSFGLLIYELYYNENPYANSMYKIPFDKSQEKQDNALVHIIETEDISFPDKYEADQKGMCSLSFSV